MRISTANAHEAGIQTLGDRQKQMAEQQERLTLGKRVARASDDPAAAARAERALAGVLRAETSQRAVEASRTVMEQTESAMADITELLQQAREQMVAAGNASYSDQERKGIATQLQGIRQQLLAAANRTDGAGTYLFGGQGATSAPFADVAGGVAFTATGGELRTDAGTALPLTVDGRSIFMQAATGNGVFTTAAGPGVTNAWIDNGRVSTPSAITSSSYTVQFSVSGASTTYAILKDGNPTAVTAAPYTPGGEITVDGMTFRITGTPANGNTFTTTPSTPTLSIFRTLDDAIAELGTAGRTTAQIAQTNTDSLRDIDQTMAALSRARSVTGEVLQLVDNEGERLATQKLANQTERSRAEDLDMVQAISDFQNQQTGYEAALKSYSMVQRLSLFQYIS